MNWISVLHFYQPPFQKQRVLEQIVHECYLPLTQKLIETNKDFCVYFNINKSLLDQLVSNNHEQVISNIVNLIESKKVKLCQTPSYHPIIPLVDKEEVLEQVAQNDIQIKKLFGVKEYDLFFSPELAVEDDPLQEGSGAPSRRGSKLISQNALGGSQYFPFISYKGQSYVVRHKNISNMIMGGSIRSSKNLNFNELGVTDTFVTVVDAETFGHHRKGYEQVLINLINEIPPSSLDSVNFKVKEVEKVISASWSTTHLQKPFGLWKDGGNVIHTMLWGFVDYLKELKVEDKIDINKYHQIYSSCTFWWASANPWWSLEMVDNGAWLMYESVFEEFKVEKQEAYLRYSGIMLEALKWQREGRIEKNFIQNDITKKVAFKDRAKEGEFEEYLNRFKKAENLAVRDKNYELATRWRDAQNKLVSGNDKYDGWHVVDQLRVIENDETD